MDAINQISQSTTDGVFVTFTDPARKSTLELLPYDPKRQSHFPYHQFVEAQEAERKRIAAELHDGIGQILGAIKYKLEGMITENEYRTPLSKQLQRIVHDIRYAMDEVRKIAMDLRPSILDDLGLLMTIEWFCREFQNTYTNIKIDKRIAVNETGITNDHKLAIYRIVQEAMNNVVKHADATIIQLQLTHEVDGIYLHINDNGFGFDISKAIENTWAHGFGLKNMRERAELTGGIFSIESIADEGASIQIFWPRRVY